MVSDIFYPVTLLLEINNFQPFQQIIDSFLRGCKIAFLFGLPFLFFILACSILITRQNGES